MRGGLGGAGSELSAPRGIMESSLTGTMGGRSPPAPQTHIQCTQTHVVYKHDGVETNIHV